MEPEGEGALSDRPNCLRKVVDKPDGSRWVEVVAGVPNKEGYQDGPAKEAMFLSFYRGVVCNSLGRFTGSRAYRAAAPAPDRERDGFYSALKRPDNTSGYFLNFAMGGTGCWLLSLGENDDTLYVSDYYGQDGYVVLKCDVKTGLLTRACGVRPKDRATWPESMKERMKSFNSETDGPALTHAGGNSGMWGTYDAFHRASGSAVPTRCAVAG